MVTRFPSISLPGMLAATAMGVYLLVVAGAVTAVTDAASACMAWPACGDGSSLPATTDGWIAIGHRLAAIVVGVVLVFTTLLAWRRGVEARVKAALGLAVVLYPLQAGIGAVVAVAGASASLSAIHLALGVLIFASTLAALAWRLEILTGHGEQSGREVDTAGDSTDGSGAPPADGVGTPSPERPDLPTSRIARAKLTVRAYYSLMKPRLMWLLCLVAAAAMALAGGPGFTPGVVAATLVGGALAIGASGTFNHVLERDVDRRMQRTSDRPLATDLVPVGNAVAFGIILAGISLALFAWVNLLAAALGLVAIVFYSVIYTLVLKPNTVQNTVIGGAAGALPALIGWAAVTGEIGLGGVLLATLIFAWTPAHFYNLALAYKEDYARGGFPMMPVVRGETATRRHIVWYLGATLAVAAALAAWTELGWLFAATTVVVGAVFLWAVIRLHFERTETAAFRAFHASNAYLGLALLAVLFDATLF
ncbi:heme o synthase [Halalkaliarchaeum desulfuricum]|uniref:heme o synthase n=1 Tax=Halalkaliarchaeum desulfuricum TaxID=2055893 RepID=UPI003743028E